MSTRGIRGATTIEKDEPDLLLAATADLLHAIQQANPSLRPEDIASVWFTLTPDLCSVHPAQAARRMGWDQVPLLCAQEIPVPGSLSRCIRVLLHWNTPLAQNQIKHIYLGKAASLRPDLTKEEIGRG